MMKKLLLLMLVLGMASMASATVIDVVLDGVGSSGNLGTSSSPLVEGETIGIKIVLNDGPDHSTYAPYDGYWISSMNLGLAVSNAGSFTATTNTAGTIKSLKVNPNITAWFNTAITSTGVSQLMATFGGSGTSGAGSGADLVWSFVVTVGSNPGDIVIDMSRFGQTDWKVYTPDSWVDITNAQLGDLTIVPEPMTMALLGLGGLFLRRRK